jgi:hypothetical protein
MRLPRRLALWICLSLAALGALGAAQAQAATVWNLEIHHNQTNFPPGGKAQYWLDLNNVGSSASAGQVSLTVELPAGITLAKALTGEIFEFRPVVELEWSCAGTTTVECTTTDSIPRHTLAHLILEVNVGALAGEEPVASATLEGGGAASAASDEEPAPIDPEPAPFGVFAPSFVPDFLAADGTTPEREAGGHPDTLSFPVDFNSVFAPTAGEPTMNRESESLRDLATEQPPGFIGAPTAVGECSPALFTLGECPFSSQVGRFDGSVYSPGAGVVFNFTTAVFNMIHPRGAVTDLAFQVNSNPVHVKASLDPANRYAILARIADLNETLPPFGGRVTLWGVPADKSHDAERCKAFTGAGRGGGITDQECSTDHERAAFLTMPAQCESPNTFRLLEYDSWQHTGLFGPPLDHTIPGLMEDCGKPRFEPDVSLAPTGRQASTPTGLDVHVTVPQNPNPNGLGTPPAKSAVVTFPPGMAINPGFADGLAGCAMDQFGISPSGVPNGEAVRCPDNSRIGEVSASTPLVPKPAEGSMYLARQEANPFGSLFAVYLALHDSEERGVLVKVAGKLSLDPATGQITASFEDLPQFPVQDVALKFRSGARAPLVNPPTCGTHTINAEVASYARPDEAIDASSSYQVKEGPGGGPCQQVASERPFDPQLIAGTQNPLAGAFSPLSLRVARTDADQEISSLRASLPAGLSGSIRGIARCPEAQIAAARARSHPGEGALELASPSCPAASQVGTVEAGAGAGPNPIYVPGKVYLAGPYGGAPLSGVAIVPALAGPADLGVVVVRSPVFLDPRSARITIATDPLPQIVNGVLIRVQDVRVRLDRPRFALNPTSCEPKAIEATLRSSEGAIKADSERFQVGDCANLGFKPALGLKLIGGTKRGAHPALQGTYIPRKGDANLKSLVLRFPHSAFLDQGHIRTICTRVQFAAGAGNGAECPPGSVYGHVTAYTPLLDEPLSGAAFLRSSNHNLPDLVFALHGIVDLEASARIDSKNGGIRASFEAVPDAPLEKVVVNMQGAQKGLIVNSTNLCKGRHLADVQMAAQSGRRYEAKPAVRAAGCGKHSRRRKSHRGA